MLEIKKKVEEYVEQKMDARFSRAYVMFRSMEGPARLLDRASQTRFQCCGEKCHGDNYKGMNFEGTNLEIIRGPDPSMIIWENLGVSQTETWARRVFTCFVCLCLTGVTIYGILYFKKIENEHNIDWCCKTNFCKKTNKLVNNNQLSIVISLVNVIAKWVLKYIAIFDRRVHRSAWKAKSARNIFIFSTFNMGIVILLSSIKIGLDENSRLPLLTGKYK